MEFRCRLGTPGGEIVEGVYIADSEARLRRELEEKGLYVLSLQRRAALSLSLGARRQRIKRQEFLVFNQELATLLKAGMPLVQSLDILRQRVANPTFKSVLDSVYDRVRSGTALSDAFNEHGAMFPAVYSASLLAGERSGNLDAVIRRYVAYEKIIGAVKRRTLSALIYPAILVTMMIILIGIIVLRVVPAFSDFYANFDRGLPLSTRIIVAISNGVVSNIGFIVVGVVGLAVAANGLVPPACSASPTGQMGARPSVGRRDYPQVFHVASGAHVGDAAWGWDSARERPRDRRAVVVEPASRA